MRTAALKRIFNVATRIVSVLDSNVEIYVKVINRLAIKKLRSVP